MTDLEFTPTANTKKPRSRSKVRTPEYIAYQNARTRCRDTTRPDYKNYGERGIEFRFNSFAEFFAEIKTRPSSQHSLERKNNNGHYEVGNVKWATKIEQGENKRNNRWLISHGVRKTITAWGRVSPVDRRLISKRLKLGWCTDCAIWNKPDDICAHKNQPNTTDSSVVP